VTPHGGRLRRTPDQAAELTGVGQGEAARRDAAGSRADAVARAGGRLRSVCRPLSGELAHNMRSGVNPPKATGVMAGERLPFGLEDPAQRLTAPTAAPLRQLAAATARVS
jgi:hypothetical protein